MPQPTAASPRTAALDRLRASLHAVTVQDLRQAARLWGWPVKGTAKAEIIEQLTEHLTDPVQMAPAFRGLSLIQQQAAIWLARLGRTDDQGEALRTVIGMAEGRDMPKQTATRTIAELRQRLLLVADPYQGIHIPDIYAEWLPRSEAPGLAFRGQPVATLAALSPEELDQHVEHLLAAIQSDRPSVEASLQVPAAQNRPQPGATRGVLVVKPHAGIVTETILARWGYTEPREQDLARTLLGAMIAGNLCLIRELGLELRLVPNTEGLPQWHELSPEVRRLNVQHWWLHGGQPSAPARAAQFQLVWDELDMALRSQAEYSLRQGMEWLNRDQLDNQVRAMRVWLMKLVDVFQREVWYSVPRLLELIYQLRRDLFAGMPYYVGWNWYNGETRLDTQQLTLRLWDETFGALVLAWLTGPARWFGLIQVAVEGEHPTAFMRPSTIMHSAAAKLAPDTLHFPPDGTLILRNSWKAGELRQALRKIGREVSRSVDVTIYTLDAAAFRGTLREGQSADQVIQIFADAGFPLPAALCEQLREWQSRMGRHHLYDNLGIIEFSDDVTLAEVQAATSLGRAELYPISPRCVVVLRPDTLPALLEELRRKGYTPQVVS
jgi:hypothetical protein